MQKWDGKHGMKDVPDVVPFRRPGQSHSAMRRGVIGREEVERAVRAIQSGRRQEASFRVVYQFYSPKVTAFLRRRVTSAKAREDLEQDSFLRIYKGLATYRFEGCLDAWVMTVVKNCHRLWRDRQPGGPKAVDFVPLDSTGEPAASLASASGGSYDSDSVNPERSTLNRERHRLLYEAIKSLPPQEYRCTILRVRHDLSVKQIAHSLRLAEGTVKAHLSHAREKLRSELGSLFSNIDF